MSVDELVEWQAYDMLTEIGPARQDFNAAKICQTIAQAQGLKKRGDQPTAITDFLINFDRTYVAPDESEPTQSPDEMLELFKALTMSGSE